MAEVSDPNYPDERLVVCKNTALAAQRTHKREDLLCATERELDKIVKATQRSKRPLRGKDKLGLRVGKVLGRFKVAKHFVLDIADDSFSYSRNEESINTEAALDGLYVIRTNVSKDTLDAEQAVEAYKSLSNAERAFRSYKTVDLKVRPIYHHLSDRVRAHVFLCMLAYYVEWHMRKSLAPLLFDDEHPDQARAQRPSVVAPAQRSASALEKAHTKRTADGWPVHSFQTLLRHLSTIAKNCVQPHAAVPSFDVTTRPDAIQQRTFDLLGLQLSRF
jgi:transposase